MILDDEKLLKVSENIFQIIDESEDKSRPLEWRRDFNFIQFSLKNIELITSCNVHTTESYLEIEEFNNPLTFVKPDISDQLAITGILDKKKMRDSLYYAVEDNESDKHYFTERVKRKIKVTVESGTPSKENEKTTAGIYKGSVFRFNLEPGEDNLHFSLTIPKEQLLLLQEALRKDKSASIEFGVDLLSFTYEVDDALREYYQPRDIVINESTQGFVTSVRVISKIKQTKTLSNSETETELSDINSLDEEEMIQEQQSNQELLKILLSYSKPLNRVANAIWVLILVIILYVVFQFIKA